MLIIEISELENGAHRNQNISGALNYIADGWAVVPDDVEVPASFPFVDIITDETGAIVRLDEKEVPEPEPKPEIEPEPTSAEILDALLGVTTNE